MRVTGNHVVSVRYRVTTPDGELIEQGQQPMRYLHGGYQGIFPKIEQSLDGLPVGAVLTVHLLAEEAFGAYDDQLLRVEPLASLPPPVGLGQMFETERPGTGQIDVYKVVEIREGYVVLDANHPLAGQDLLFDLTIDGIRPASQQEMAQGYPSDLSP